MLRYPKAARDPFIDETPDFFNKTAPPTEDLVFGQFYGELITWENLLEILFAEEQVFIRIMGASHGIQNSFPCDPIDRNTNKTYFDQFYGSQLMYQTGDYLHHDPMAVRNRL